MVAIIAGLVGVSACKTTAPRLTVAELEAASEHLNRPLQGDPVALYRLRVPSSGGLRMAMRTSGEEGRLTVSEPFGSAVSITAWNGLDPPIFFDLREGCLLEDVDLSQIVGIDVLPMPQAVRLLGGRMPTVEGDTIVVREDGQLLVEGRGWAAAVTVAAEPWRVVLVEEVDSVGSGWRLRLDDHTSSVPGRVLVERKGGRRVELNLIRLEWKEGDVLPALPDLPKCSPARP